MSAVNLKINEAVINYVLTNIREGKIGYCRQLGFDERELAEINSLSNSELQDVCDSTLNFVDIKLNHKLFWSLLESAKKKSRDLNKIDRCLELGISGKMLSQRFGWGSSEISGRRKLLGVAEKSGRKENASEDEEHALYELWKKHQPDNLQTMYDKNQGLDILILLSEESGLSMAEVWRLTELWIKMEI